MSFSNGYNPLKRNADNPDLQLVITKQSVSASPSTEFYQNFRFLRLLNPSDISAILADLSRGYLVNYIYSVSQVFDSDPDIAAICASRVDRAVSTEWEVAPASNDLDDQIAAKFIKDVLSNIPGLYSHLLRIADAIIIGYSAHELEWKYRDGNLVVSDLQWVNPRRFIYAPPKWDLKLYDYGMRGSYGEDLLPDKWIVHQSYERQGDPCYAGVMRTVLPWWLYRAWNWKFWSHYNEVFAIPHLYATVDEATPASIITATQSALQNLSYDHVAVFKGNSKIESIKTADTSTLDSFNRYMEVTSNIITRYVLGTSDINQAGDVGSMAAVSTRVGATADPKRERDRANLSATIQDQLFEALITKNMHLFSKRPSAPRFGFKKEEPPAQNYGSGVQPFSCGHNVLKKRWG
jgi:phage gp29-like protein